MQLYNDTQSLRQAIKKAKLQNRQIGLVPTMGALHQGHLSLVRRSCFENDITVVSIFVNPTQFNDSNDLLAYPRTLSRDLEHLQSIPSEIWVFAPTAEDIYSGNTLAKTYNFKGLDHYMEGPNRPNHFNGVATIVEKLFRIVQPDKAYFGEKDYQQLRIVDCVNKQKRLKVEIVPCPIVRESSGLAMSSRNERLSKSARLQSAIIYQQLLWVKRRFHSLSFDQLKEHVSYIFDQVEGMELEYFEIVNQKKLEPASIRQKNKLYRAFIAVKVEGVRLIDNLSMNE